jgi:outer membrane receptor protein involved in Fe transport
MQRFPGVGVKPTHPIARWLICALLIAATERVASAEDVSGLEGMLAEPIVSSASTQSEGASSAPALSMSLSAEDLRRYGVKTLAEAIDFLAIAVSSSDNLNGGEVGARGVLLTGDRGSHFLLLVDGNVMNDPLRGGASFGVGAGIPLELVDHIEIVVGPGSVLYGSNAMLGLVNVVTKRAKDYSGARVIVESALPTSIRTAVGVGTPFTLFGQDGEVTTQLEYFKQEGPDFFFNAENTGVDRFTGQPGRNSRNDGPTGIWGGRNAKHSLFAEAPSGIVRVALGNTELHLQGSYYKHGAPTGPGDFDDPATGERETRASLGLSHRIAVSTLLDLSVRGYASYYETKSHFIASRGVLCPFGLVTCDYASTGSASWVGLEMQSTWDWFRDGHFVTIVGADGRRRGVQTRSDTLEVDTGAPLYPADRSLDRSDFTVAGYAQQTWAVSQTVKLNGGARVDSDPRFSPVVTPRIAGDWNPWAGGTIKLSYASAFRAPSWDEADNSTARRIKADHLLPEKVQSFDASVQHHFGTHRLVMGGFYSHWTNLVELVALSDAEAIAAIRNGQTTVPFTPGIELTQYRNSRDFTNYGMNMGLDGAIDSGHVLYGLTLTGALAKRNVSSGTTRLPVAPQLLGNARLAFVLGQDLPTIALATHILGPRPADLSDGQFTPTPYAPTQVELRLTLSGDAPLIKGLSYRAMVNYAVADRGPYVVGPVTSSIPTQTSPQLIPVDRFRTTVGLAYAF